MFDRIGGQPVLYSSHKLAGLAIQTAGHPGSRSGALGTCMNLTPASHDVHIVLRESNISHPGIISNVLRILTSELIQ